MEARVSDFIDKNITLLGPNTRSQNYTDLHIVKFEYFAWFLILRDY